MRSLLGALTPRLQTAVTRMASRPASFARSICALAWVSVGCRTLSSAAPTSIWGPPARAADAVAVIGPPYFKLDDRALLEHLAAAAAACAPLPFYVYEFERTSGYAVPLTVIEELRTRAPNLAGLKVSDTPLERFTPYLVE